MDTVNKHPDANESVDSFEDAIDNLDLQEDNMNSSNVEYNSKHSHLKKDEVSLNNNVALPNEKINSTKTIAENQNTKNMGILNTIVEDVNTVNKSINAEAMSIKTSILSSECDEKVITDNIAITSDDCADFIINKTQSDLVSNVTSDLKIVQDESISGKDDTMEKSSQQEKPKTFDKDIVKDSNNKALSSSGKNHEFANESINTEIFIENPSNELVKEKISLNNDTVSDIEKRSLEPVHNHINSKAIQPNSKVGSNNETIQLDSKGETKKENAEPRSGNNNNEKVEPHPKVDTYDLETKNENIQGENELKKSEDSVDNTDEEGSIKSEREQGDGQGEQEEVKKELELDEDKRNPEYIPKKGSFYEHDTRTLDGFDDDVKKFEEEIAVKNKKKSKSIAAEGKWQHDKYDEQEQCPKSQQEIIDLYGYDIRNEEHPPKARRNRRYGRGPNKYNRNWEDEKAYIKIEYKGPRNSEGRHSKSINERSRQNKPPTREDSDFREHQNSVTPNADIVDNSDKYPPLLHYSDKIGMKAEKGGWAPPPPFSQKNVVNKTKLGGDSDSAKPQARYDRSNQDQDQPDECKVPALLPNCLPPKDLPTIVADKSGPPKQKAFSSLPLNNMPAFVPATAYRPSPTAKGPSVNIPPNWYLSQNKIERTGPPDSPDLSHKDYSKLPGGIAALRGGKRYSVQRQQSLESRSASTPAEIDAMPTEETGPPSQALPPSAFYHHPATGPAPFGLPKLPSENYSENASGTHIRGAIFYSKRYSRQWRCSPKGRSDFATDAEEIGVELGKTFQSPAPPMKKDDLQKWLHKLPSSEQFYPILENEDVVLQEEEEESPPPSASMENIKGTLQQAFPHSSFYPSMFSDQKTVPSPPQLRFPPPPVPFSLAARPVTPLFDLPSAQTNKQTEQTKPHLQTLPGNLYPNAFPDQKTVPSPPQLRFPPPPVPFSLADQKTVPSPPQLRFPPPPVPFSLAARPVTPLFDLPSAQTNKQTEQTKPHLQTLPGNLYPNAFPDQKTVPCPPQLRFPPPPVPFSLAAGEGEHPLEEVGQTRTLGQTLGNDNPVTEFGELDYFQAMKVEIAKRDHTISPSGNDHPATDFSQLEPPETISKAKRDSIIKALETSNGSSEKNNEMLRFLKSQFDVLDESVTALKKFNMYLSSLGNGSTRDDTLVHMHAVRYADCHESFPTNDQTPPISLPQSSPSHLVFRQSPPPPVKVISADASCYHSHLYPADNPHPISNGAGGAPPMLLPVHFVSPPPTQVPSFNSAQAPIMNYGPQPLQFQPMQPIVSLPPPPQTEVFQPAGGITYYSPQTQAVLQRPALSKRVKSAIPIVPPSEVNIIQQTNPVQQPPNNVALLSNPIQQPDAVINNVIQQKVQLVPVENSKEDNLKN